MSLYGVYLKIALIRDVIALIRATVAQMQAVS